MIEERKSRERKIFRSLGIVFAVVVLAAIGLCALPVPVDPAAGYTFKPINGASDIFTVVLKPDAKPVDIEAAVRDHCGARQFCQVLGWVDPTSVARAFPMTDRELLDQVFEYELNRNTGLDRAAFSCRQWPSTPKNQCRGELTQADLDEANGNSE
ncbi:MAG: hypothetical protein K2Y20_14035 [Sphingomonas sp.]|nr:hypothetical protein [Sphingomonas sp.]